MNFNPKTEKVLPNDYPMYAGYWYLLDGEPKINVRGGMTVGTYKKLSGVQEIRRCDAVERKLVRGKENHVA